jgi:hypothetical protein
MGIGMGPVQKSTRGGATNPLSAQLRLDASSQDVVAFLGLQSSLCVKDVLMVSMACEERLLWHVLWLLALALVSPHLHVSTLVARGNNNLQHWL